MHVCTCVCACMCVHLHLEYVPSLNWEGHQQQTGKGAEIPQVLKSPGLSFPGAHTAFPHTGSLRLPLSWLCSWESSHSTAGQMLSSSSVVSTKESSSLGLCVFLGNGGSSHCVSPRDTQRRLWQQKEMISLTCFQHEAHAFSSPSAAYIMVGSPELPALPSLWHIIVMKIVSCL